MDKQTTDHTKSHTQQEIHAVRHSQPSRQKQRFRDKQCPDHAEMGQANMQPNRRGQKVRYRCGSLAHHHRDCPFLNAVCYGYDRKGQIQAVCRSSGKPTRKGRMAKNMVEQRTEFAVDLFSTSTHVDKPQILLQISNIDLVFELDTGAAVSLVGPDIWKRIGSPHFTGVARIFVWGAPGRRHPVLYQSCTRLKLSLAAKDLWALQQSAESWVEPQSGIKIAKIIGEMTFGGGFL